MLHAPCPMQKLKPMKTKTTILALLLLSSALNAQQWYVLNSPTGGNGLRAVHFVSQTTGWVGGSEGTIMKTTDGGAVGRSNSFQPHQLFSIFILPTAR